MVATPHIARKLIYKRQERRFLYNAVRQAAQTLTLRPASLSVLEFEASLDQLAADSETRLIPDPDVFSRENIYADHD